MLIVRARRKRQAETYQITYEPGPDPTQYPAAAAAAAVDAGVLKIIEILAKQAAREFVEEEERARLATLKKPSRACQPTVAPR